MVFDCGKYSLSYRQVDDDVDVEDVYNDDSIGSNRGEALVWDDMGSGEPKIYTREEIFDMVASIASNEYESPEVKGNRIAIYGILLDAFKFVEGNPRIYFYIY